MQTGPKKKKKKITSSLRPIKTTSFITCHEVPEGE
jgi:hypothetical protein